MMNKLKRKAGKKGAYSIIIILLTLVLVLAFTGYTDVLRKTYVMNEIQQRMDTAGLNSLNDTIDIERLRYEELSIDENNHIDSRGNTAVLSDYKNKLSEAYKKEIYNTIRTNDLVKDISVERVNATFDLEAWGTGKKTTAAPQITLDGVVSVTLKNSTQFDVMGTNKQDFYDARSGQNFTITVRGQNEDGLTELIIRSSTRLVYR